MSTETTPTASFRIGVTPHRRAAARFVAKVRRQLQKALADNPEVTQSAIAELLGVHRAVVNRQFKGTADISLGRVAELAHALGYEPEFSLLGSEGGAGSNVMRPIPPAAVIAGSPFRSVAVTPASGNLDLKQGIRHVSSTAALAEMAE